MAESIIISRKQFFIISVRSTTSVSCHFKIFEIRFQRAFGVWIYSIWKCIVPSFRSWIVWVHIMRQLFLFSYCFTIENNRKHAIFEDFDLEMGLNRWFLWFNWFCWLNKTPLEHFQWFSKFQLFHRGVTGSKKGGNFF